MNRAVSVMYSRGARKALLSAGLLAVAAFVIILLATATMVDAPAVGPVTAEREPVVLGRAARNHSYAGFAPARHIADIGATARVRDAESYSGFDPARPVIATELSFPSARDGSGGYAGFDPARPTSPAAPFSPSPGDDFESYAGSDRARR
jgi:hypothetical protein